MFNDVVIDSVGRTGSVHSNNGSGIYSKNNSNGAITSLDQHLTMNNIKRVVIVEQ